MTRRARFSRLNTSRTVLQCAAIALVSTSVGCMSLITLPGMPGRDKADNEKTLAELTDDTPDLIGKFTHPFGMDYVKVESISLTALWSRVWVTAYVPEPFGDDCTCVQLPSTSSDHFWLDDP